MAEVSPPEAAPGPLSLVAEGGLFSGLVIGSGDLAIEGQVNGDVLARGRLTVGEKAVIRGRVCADEVVVLGRVEGRVEARTRAELAATARVVGDLASPRLVTVDGCRLEGRLVMHGDPEEAARSS
jgi:cytoskeletal protein CcmA (bactofilin family)